MQIIPIASGKGGVGKSLLAANLAITLGQAGKRVVLADLDLGASNLHLALGQNSCKHGIGTFLNGTSEFEDTLIQTRYENLTFIPGDSEIPGFAALRASQKNALTKKLLSLKTDYLILDLGAGTHLGILDFFLLSPQGIIVTEPAITATLNAYLFLKNAMFRILTASYKKGSKGNAFLEKTRSDSSAMQRMYIPALIQKLKKEDPENTVLFLKKIERFKPRLVMNMLDDPKESDTVLKIKRSCKEYLAINLEHLGVVYRDSQQDIALASRLPIVVYKPQALISQAIYRIADKILQSESEHFYSSNEYEAFTENSFSVADMEAQIDFKSKLGYIEELIGAEAISVGDLAEMIKSQQYEISTLKKQNMLLQHKIKKAIENGFKV